MSEIKLEVFMQIKTCKCGTAYCIPGWILYDYLCPMCGERKIQKMVETEIECRDEIAHLKKVIAGLQGALGRKKGNSTYIGRQEAQLQAQFFYKKEK